MSFDYAITRTPEGLEEAAVMLRNMIYKPGDSAFCEPHEAVWTLEILLPAQLSTVFADAATAAAWFSEQIELAEVWERDQNPGNILSTELRQMLVEDIRLEVIVLMRAEIPYIWDGLYRIAASIATGRAVKAIVGRPIPELPGCPVPSHLRYRRGTQTRSADAPQPSRSKPDLDAGEGNPPPGSSTAPAAHYAILAQLFTRYITLARANASSLDKLNPRCQSHALTALCTEAIAHGERYPFDKMNRWLGFTQGVLASQGIIDVDEERELTRPLLHQLHTRAISSWPPQ